MHTAKMWMSSAVGVSEVSGTVNFENLNSGWPGCLGVTHPKKRVWKWPEIQPMIRELHCIQAFIFQIQPYGTISNSALRVWISLPFLVIALCPALSLCIIRAPRKSSAGRGLYSIGCGWWRWRPTNMNVHPKLRLVYEGMGSMVLGGCQLEQTAKTTRTAVSLGQNFAAFSAPAKWITTRGVDDAKRLMSLISSFPSVHPFLSSWTHTSSCN